MTFAISAFDQLQGWVITWLPIIFMGLIAVVLLRMMKIMPRVKPQQIKPSSKSAIGWDDIAGVVEAKRELREVVDFLQNPKKFKKLGAVVPKGILLHGPPGTGKTLLAKAVARESKARFFSQSAASFVEMFAGLGAARIRRLFREAREHAPAIIFIDELDAVGISRGGDGYSREQDQTLNQLLVEMDGFEPTSQLVVIAASNRMESLDKALLRPGRFDRQILVTLPDTHGRESILEVHTQNKPLDPTVDLNRVARHTSGLSGADLANICNEAAIFAGRRGGTMLEGDDFDSALERVLAGLLSHRALTDRDKRVVAWHEAGHALVSELTESVDKVQKISIVPRGRALGYTLNLPEEERHLKSRDELLDYMKVLLGGRVSEEIVFGSVTTGAADDLKKVTQISHSMVYEYGMGTEHFSLTVPADDLYVSDATRALRDEEQRTLADEAYEVTKKLISDHRDLLDEFAERLMANEVLERDDITEIMSSGKKSKIEQSKQDEQLPALDDDADDASRRMGA